MAPSVTAALAAFWVALGVPALGQSTEPFIGAHGATAPASYAGTVAGADWHLDLWPDQAFHLRRTPAADGAPLADAGRWHAADGALVLDLGEERLAVEVRNATRLRPEGAPDDASGDLVTEGTLDFAALTLPVSGMLTYFADAASFVHCATGKSYPVPLTGDWLAAERAYLADRPGPGAPLFVTFDATIALREPMEGPVRPMAVVDRFGATWPGEDCTRAAPVPLAGTVWRLTAIGDMAVDWAPPAREPYLVLHGDDRAFNASVGCNTMRGGYDLSGSRLSFGPAASTMMACPDDLAAAEAALGRALPAVQGFAVGGRTLRLLGGDGAILAALEAVYLP